MGKESRKHQSRAGNVAGHQHHKAGEGHHHHHKLHQGPGYQAYHNKKHHEQHQTADDLESTKQPDQVADDTGDISVPNDSIRIMPQKPADELESTKDDAQPAGTRDMSVPSDSIQMPTGDSGVPRKPAGDSTIVKLDDRERNELSTELEAFVVQHATLNRPVALVSSGGTAADLEMHSVRCLDNFSTGIRGAKSVEGFLRRGYAVIHLWRRGSASPFARLLAEELGLAPHAALDVMAMGKIFGGGDEEEDAAVKQVLRNEDPWLTRTDLNGDFNPQTDLLNQEQLYADGVCLSRALSHSTQLKKALRERNLALKEKRLLTIPFRTVEEYLSRLQLCAEAVHCCRSLALTYLAAAVSDFYVPSSERAEHKIQSSEVKEEGLVLHLKPVPKTIGCLRTEWAPLSFCVSFKLETDFSILRKKAERAVEAYGVHMVVGNMLETRHSKVWLLMPETQRVQTPESADGWTFEEVSRTLPSDPDLDELILDKVVESHFEFISFHAQGKSIEEARLAQESLQEKRRQIQRELFWKRASALASEVAGVVLSGLLSWAVATAVQRARRGA